MMFYATVIFHGCNPIHQLVVFLHSQSPVELLLMVNHFTSVKNQHFFKSKWIFNQQFLHLGRAYHEGSLTIGKVQISHGALYIPFAGSEVSIHSEIEVLVEN